MSESRPPEPSDAEPRQENALQEASDDILDYLEGLLDAMEIEGKADVIAAGEDELTASIDGPDGALLIGRKGRTLDAIQDLLRQAVQREGRPRFRVSLDVEGYRGRRRQAVEKLAHEGVREAMDHGEAELEPMTPYERKIVHDIVALTEGVSSFSEGQEPDRRVVVRDTSSA